MRSGRAEICFVVRPLVPLRKSKRPTTAEAEADRPTPPHATTTTHRTTQAEARKEKHRREHLIVSASHLSPASPARGDYSTLAPLAYPSQRLSRSRRPSPCLSCCTATQTNYKQMYIEHCVAGRERGCARRLSPRCSPRHPNPAPSPTAPRTHPPSACLRLRTLTAPPGSIAA